MKWHICMLVLIHLRVGFSDTSVRSDEDENAQKIKQYEVVYPLQYEDFNHTHRIFGLSSENIKFPGSYKSKIYYSLKFEDRTLNIDLNLTKLLPQSFSVISYETDHRPEIYSLPNDERKHCHYQGYVRGVKGSKVIVSTCKGLRGIIMLDKGYLLIDRLKNGSYIMHRENDSNLQSLKFFCGIPTTSFFNSFSKNLRMLLVGRKNVPAVVKQTASDLNRLKYVELFLVASKALCDHFVTRDEVLDFLIDLTNVADGFYQEMGVHVVLTGIELWNRGDEISNTGTASKIADDFSKYRVNRANSNRSSPWATADTVFLVHGDEFDNNDVIGIATQGSMCDSSSSGIVLFSVGATIRTGATLVHEMGHNLGLEHVNDGVGQNCPCTAEECMMDVAHSYTATVSWSECSRVNLTTDFETGKYMCLYNVPDASGILAKAACGNTIVEENEECDCGFQEQCKSQCCDFATCKLKPGAACDEGICCENCQFMSRNVKCREKLDECDFPEYCTGESAYCPLNTYKENGVQCLLGQAACYEGFCLTLDFNCRAAFGIGARSHSACFDFNLRGFPNGNCGRDSFGFYFPCLRKDRFCGRLFCVGILQTSHGYITLPDGTNCGALLSSFASVSGAGYVKNGVSCGLGKVCMNQQCQDVPPTQCSDNCHSDEVCDNFGRCKCGLSNLSSCNQPISTTGTTSSSISPTTSLRTDSFAMGFTGDFSPSVTGIAGDFDSSVTGVIGGSSSSVRGISGDSPMISRIVTLATTSHTYGKTALTKNCLRVWFMRSRIMLDVLLILLSASLW